MIQGVHAETIVFTDFQQTRSLLLNKRLPLMGTASEFREVRLKGSRPRRFRVRTPGLRESGKTVACQLEMHDVNSSYAPCMKLELSFLPDGNNTRVRLNGSAARDLSPASAMQVESSRTLANEYARGLLDQIARAIEAGSARRHAATA